MIKRELSTDISLFPLSVRQYLEASRIYDSSSSKIKVYYSDAGYYVKVAEKGKLSHEAELSRRFFAPGIGVEVLEYLSTDRDYLVTREAVGTDLTHCTDDPGMICAILAAALKRLHALPCAGVALAHAYVEYMRIADSEAHKKEFGSTAVTDYFGITDFGTALDIVRANSKKLTADTFIHGDACLPNVIQNGGKFSAFIDFEMSGKGDKHIDLYWAVWSLWYNLNTASYTDLFLDMYGRENFDIELVRTVAALEVLC